MKYKILLLIFILQGLIFTSCIKDEYNLQNIKTPGWDPNFAAPLINSKLSMWDIVNDYDSSDVFEEDVTHFLSFIYTTRVASQTAEELIQISDQNMNTSFSFSTGGIVQAGNSFVTNFTYFYDFQFPSNQVIDSIFLKTGNLNVSFSCNINMPVKIELTLPGTKNGQPFKETFNFSGTSFSQNIDLANSKLLFTHTGGNNRLEMNVKIELIGQGNPDNSPYTLNIANSYTGIGFKALFGYLGPLNFALNEDTITIRVYDNNQQGIIHWEDPKIFLKITNYLGMPLAVNIDLLEAVRSKPPQNTIQITGPAIPNPWNILYPGISQAGQGVQTMLKIDKDSSNIKDALNISPQSINSMLSAEANQPGITQQNFAFDTSRFIVDARVELPLWGTAEGFSIVDTIPLDIGEDFKNPDQIEWVLFKIYCCNDFPVDAYLQIYFTDENNIIVDSLLSPYQQFVHSALPGPPPDYIVTQGYTKIITTKIEKERIREFHRIKNAIIHAKLDTFSNASQIVKFYSFYKMHVMLGAQVQLKF